jgi:hypothetical protein
MGDNTINATTGTKRVLCGPGVYVYAVQRIANVLATTFDAVTVDGSTGRITVTRLY